MERGSKEMQKIADAIETGAFAYLKKEYFYILIVSIILGFVFYFALDFIFYGGIPFTLVSFIVGTVSSIFCGFIGMYISTHAKFRTAQASKEGLNKIQNPK
jgi:K(+)-stimulated pyrophosphate-energized sodium pump